MNVLCSGSRSPCPQPSQEIKWANTGVWRSIGTNACIAVQYLSHKRGRSTLSYILHKWDFVCATKATLAERYQCKKCIWVQEQAEEYYEEETQWGLLTIQKSHPPEVHHLKIAGGWKSVWEDPYTLLLLSPTQPSQPLLRAGSASSHDGLDGPSVWPQKPFSLLTLCSALRDYFCYYSFTDPFPCSRPLPFDFSMHNVYYVWRKLNLPCAKAQRQSHSCRMLLVQGLLQTPAVLPLTSVGLNPIPYHAGHLL